MHGPKPLDHTNKRYGQFTVISKAHKKGRCTYWKCLCDCGKELFKETGLLKTTTSCRSCAVRKVKYSNFSKYQREQHIYRLMKRRCYNPKDSRWHQYGGRGITVSSEWLKGFGEFFKDMGPCPVKYSIERIDNDKGYFKENCKWIPMKDQAKNRRTNRSITIDGITKNLADWSDYYNVSGKLFLLRLKRGLTPYEALTAPKQNKGRTGHKKKVCNSIEL